MPSHDKEKLFSLAKTYRKMDALAEEAIPLAKKDIFYERLANEINSACPAFKLDGAETEILCAGIGSLAEGKLQTQIGNELNRSINCQVCSADGVVRSHTGLIAQPLLKAVAGLAPNESSGHAINAGSETKRALEQLTSQLDIDSLKSFPVAIFSLNYNDFITDALSHLPPQCELKTAKDFLRISDVFEVPSESLILTFKHASPALFVAYRDEKLQTLDQHSLSKDFYFQDKKKGWEVRKQAILEITKNFFPECAEQTNFGDLDYLGTDLIRHPTPYRLGRGLTSFEDAYQRFLREQKTGRFESERWIVRRAIDKYQGDSSGKGTRPRSSTETC